MKKAWPDISRHKGNERMKEEKEILGKEVGFLLCRVGEGEESLEQTD